MRTIKFRCWNKHNKEMLDVENLYWEYNKLYIRTSMYNSYFTSKELILMQFTGLYDKKRKRDL